MSVLRIDTDRYEEAAGLTADAGHALVDAVVSTGHSLLRTGGMAGWDTPGAEWAISYDSAARDVLSACQEIALASSDTSRALAFAAGNYISAEYVASMGMSALVSPFVPVSVAAGHLPTLPSASEANPGWPPPCWDLIAGIAGIIWPAGDPGLLRSASAIWSGLAGTVDASIEGPGLLARQTLEGFRAEDLTLFRERSAAVAESGRLVAEASRNIGTGCAALATAIDEAHQELLDETRSFSIECAALAAVGAGLSLVTLGGSAAVTALVGAARTAQMVARVHQIVARLSAMARAVSIAATRLPGGTRLTAALQSLARTPAVLRSTAHSARLAVEAGSRSLGASVRLARLAPAVRLVRPLGAAGLRVLDSRVVSVALSNPAALIREGLSYQVRRDILGAQAVRGSGTDQVLALLKGTRMGAAPVVPALQSVVTMKGRVETAAGLAALPGSLRDRYVRPLVEGPAVHGSAPGRLTAVQGSPAPRPRAVSTRAHRTSHPAASP